MLLSTALIVGDVCQVILQTAACTDIYMHGGMRAQAQGNLEVHLTYEPACSEDSSASPQSSSLRAL